MAPRGQKINGALVGQLRTQTLKITQAEMASRLGIHWVTQSNIENGKALVSLELVERIAEVTGASRSELLGEPEDAEAALLSRPGISGASLLETLYAAIGDALGKTASPSGGVLA